MNLSRIKNLIQQNGDKFIVLENEEPEFVIMSFAEYEKLAQYNANAANSHINAANTSRKTEDADIELEPIGSYPETVVVNEPMGLPMRGGEVRLEDLPI